MLRPFRLKQPIGPDSNMNLDDTLNTKRALNDLGFMALPDFGLTPFPDLPMIDGIKSFQRRHGLRVDGVMKPDGPTLETLNRTLEERQPPPRPIENVPLRTNLSSSASPPGKDGAKQAPQRSGPQFAMAQKPKIGQSTGATDGAGTFPLGGSAATIGAGIVARELLRQQQQKKGVGEVPIPPEPGAVRPRTHIAPPLPLTPGLEPSDDKDRPPTKTESPAKPVEVPDLSQPLPKVDKPTIFVHPVPPDELQGGMIIERKGNEDTRKELERIRDFYEGIGWKHVAGGRYSEKHELVREGKRRAGAEQEERHIKGHFKSLKGGHFTDLTFETPDGRIVHVQTVDVDRNGKPTQRELDTAERIRRAVENEHVLLIPKGAQLERIHRFRGRRQ